MPKALLIAALVFIGSFTALMLAEKLLHRISHNPDRTYRWGVWVFAILAAVWAFFTNLGR